MLDGNNTSNYKTRADVYRSTQRVDRWGIARLYESSGRPSELKTELARWLKSNKKARPDFAADLEVSLSYVNQLCTGAKTPGRALIKRIAALTHDEVRLEHWPEPTED